MHNEKIIKLKLNICKDGQMRCYNPEPGHTMSDANATGLNGPSALETTTAQEGA